MTLLSKKLIDLTEKDKRYHSLNDNSILNFPLNVPVCISIDDFLEDLFEKYYNLLCDQRELLNSDFKITEERLVEISSAVSYVSQNILEALENYRKGKIASAFDNIKEALNKGELQEIKLEANECKTFYRMRSGLGHKYEMEFYHVPFDKLHLTDNCRFSMQGFPCLYIGYTEDVCKKEIRKDGSIIQLDLKENGEPPLSLVDLTWYESSNKERGSFLISFPLIAACYIVPNYCKSINKECCEIGLRFKEQYVIPQMVSAYIRENLEVNGIRYYTTRDENLNSQKTDGMNIALFANYDKYQLKNRNRIYDDNITNNRFVFTNPHDVII